MLQRTAILGLSKRIVLPRLSPTLSQARIQQFCVSNGQTVQAYDLVLKVQPSKDMTDDPDDVPLQMALETQDEGVVQELRTELVGQWVTVGTELGRIDDGDDVDGDWTWQAYKDSVVT